jgi:hypothetical protein
LRTRRKTGDRNMKGMKVSGAGKEAGKSARRGFTLSYYNAVFFIVLSSALVLAVPHIFRFVSGNSTFPGEFPYYNARIAEAFQKQGVINYDYLSYGGRPYFFDPYHVLLADAGRIFGIENASRIVPYLLGILSSLLFLIIVRSMGFGIRMTFISTMLFVLSPLYIDTFVFSRSSSFAIFLFFLGFYLFTKDSFLVNLASMAIFLSMPLFGIPHVVASVVILLAYSIKFGKLRRYAAIFLPVILFSSIYLMPLLTAYTPGTFSVPGHDLLSTFIAGVGTQAGISIFVIILSFIGIFSTWKLKYGLFPSYAAMLALIAGTAFDKDFVLYLNILASVLAASAFLRLIRIKWEIRLVKNITLLVIVCGILFNTVSHIAFAVRSVPDQSTMDALKWLGDNRQEGTSFVLSDYSNGFWIEYWSHLPAFMDSSKYVIGSAQRYNVSDTIFHSYDLKKTRSLLVTNNIHYIYIDGVMKDGKIWKKPDEGLLLLLENNESFKNIYTDADKEIWEVLYTR